ncbi:MAG: hypothetical protein IM650_03875 [Phenylobacterium sp.]|jgi:hypothetical protein|uniref:leucine zipper domain-containing protein n=1 Tax=Phenylobacterium sp. TaxID=1871053 RepID=UPI0025F4969C|nr:leucine zipper domain-containing protein [Phenylobacterium sp.]MCA3740957.1 hypothetical protein [Phenylobacterium sp.]MCA3754643.1 hypothetical protein [Phenylobacterium sp.]MCA6226161.1 hypothetical protein [Phenylobacterium sp.]MCA6231939.1 hypothetical protein [Phenylobacterium sp.]MCA6249262.1 hypothetical protein [Phenylobacterium sp.]
MNVHQKARLTPSGRDLLAERIYQGWSVKAAAQAAASRRCPRKTPDLRVAVIRYE